MAPTEVNPTLARDLFTQMLKEGMWPRMREIGFRGSGSTFRWPADDAWVMIGIQKSSANTPDYVRFTANVSVTTKAEWEAKRVDQSFLGDKPTPNVLPWGWGTRLGHLMPARRDHWWVLETGDDWQPVADELIEAIVNLALPRMLSELAVSRGGLHR